MRRCPPAGTLVALLALGAASCGGPDYLNGGNLVTVDEELNEAGIRITREYLTYSTLPGLTDEHRYRWVAYNTGAAPRCVTVILTNVGGGGGYRYGQVYLIPPDGQRYIVAYAQNAWGAELSGDSSSRFWTPIGTDCAAGNPY